MALTNRPACLRGAGKAVVLEVSLGTTARKYYRKEKTHYDFKTTPPEARTQSSHAQHQHQTSTSTQSPHACASAGLAQARVACARTTVSSHSEPKFLPLAVFATVGGPE